MALLAKNNSLSDAAQVSNQRLAEYVKKLQAQEGGSDPSHHKINGNMAWHEREQPASSTMNQYFKSFGRDGQKVLSDLKSRVPDVFNNIATTQPASGAGDDTQPANTEPANSQPATPQPATGFIQKMKNVDPKVWYVVGGGVATITVIAILTK